MNKVETAVESLQAVVKEARRVWLEGGLSGKPEETIRLVAHKLGYGSIANSKFLEEALALFAEKSRSEVEALEEARAREFEKNRPKWWGERYDNY